jgi:polyhydroxybutyrate depolymerase
MMVPIRQFLPTRQRFNITGGMRAMKKQCFTPIKSVVVIAIIGILGTFLLPELGSAQAISKKGKPPPPTTAEYRLMTEGASTREYYIYFPASYDPATPTPLLINFHGFDGSADAYSAEVGGGGLDAVADNGNFLVAYPQAVEGDKGGRYWDPGDNGIPDIEENDVYFTERLIAHIAIECNVDLSRVYAAGYSNGGMMSYGLACRRPDIIAAIGIMSGIMLPDTCVSGEYTSLIKFHGIGDNVLPYDGSQDYQSVAAVIDFWLNHNGIPASSLVSTTFDDGRRVGLSVRDEYTGGLGNTDVTLYTVHKVGNRTAGHVWFSHEIGGTNANQILWDFVSSYSLND